MDRYFQVPNETLDVRLTIHQKMVLVYLCRAGNNGAPIYPSYSTIAEKCSMSRAKAISVVNELEGMGILIVERQRKDNYINSTNLFYIKRDALLGAGDTGLHGEPQMLSPQCRPPSPQHILPSPQCRPPSPQHIQGVVHDVDPINNQLIKNQNEEPRKKNHKAHVDISPLEKTIEDFKTHRKTMKKPMTPKAVQLMLEKLDKLADTDGMKIAILNQSIERGWQGVFPLDQRGGSWPDKTPQPSRYNITTTI